MRHRDGHGSIFLHPTQSNPSTHGLNPTRPTFDTFTLYYTVKTTGSSSPSILTNFFARPLGGLGCPGPPCLRQCLHRNANGILAGRERACFADTGNLALDKDAREMSVDEPASFAVDGDVNTHSCTRDISGNPWWTVDLARHYSIGSVVITLPNVGGEERNYRRIFFIYSIDNLSRTLLRYSSLLLHSADYVKFRVSSTMLLRNYSILFLR